MVLDLSTKVTLTPSSSLALIAAMHPAKPPPMTRTSVSTGMTFNFVISCSSDFSPHHYLNGYALLPLERAPHLEWGNDLDRPFILMRAV